MKTKLGITILIISIFLTSCVQKTYVRIVVFTLNATEIKDIKKVGIRGNDKPLSWDYDTEMKFFPSENLYKITTIFKTGYKFTEVKFVINDKFEFENEDNRKVNFSKNDTTFYKVKFNKR